MNVGTWWTLATACLIISLTPGAGAVNTMTNAISQGWRRSVWGVLGQQIALVIQVFIVAIGVGALVTAVPVVLEVVRWLGAAYLVYLGVRMLLAKPTPPPEVRHEELPEPTGAPASAPTGAAAEEQRPAAARSGGAQGTRESAWSLLRRGTLVNLLNPKAIVFFLAFIPPFIDASRPQGLQYLIIGVTCVSVDVIVMWFGFAALARPLGRLMGTTRGQRILNTVFGCCFLLVAGLLFVV